MGTPVHDVGSLRRRRLPLGNAGPMGSIPDEAPMGNRAGNHAQPRWAQDVAAQTARRPPDAILRAMTEAPLNDEPKRQHPANSVAGILRQFFQHSLGAMLAVIALFAVISFMYFEGMANPQAHLNHVPIAIVDEDQGATVSTPVGDQRLDVADQVIGGILDQNNFAEVDLRVVDRNTAESGMAKGEFFGAVVFPAELSQNIADLVTQTAGNDGAEGNAPPRAQITVLNAPRASVPAPQVMATLAGKLNESVPKQVGAQVLDNGRTLAEAAQHEVSPAAAAALADPVSIEQQVFQPLDGGVTNASFPLFFALVLVLAGFTGAMVVSQMLDSRLGFAILDIGPYSHLAPLATHSRTRVLVRKWAVTLIIAPLISIIAAGISRGIGVTAFPFWQMVLFSTVCIAAVGFASHAVIAAAGNPGMLINLLVFVVFGIPTSSGAIPAEMLPRWFDTIGQVEPINAGVRGIRAMLFTPDAWNDGLGHAYGVLFAWFVGAIVLGLAVTKYYDRRGFTREPNGTPLPPALAKALEGEDADTPKSQGDDPRELEHVTSGSVGHERQR